MVAVAILAGGRSRRLPGKLAMDAGGLPLVVRVYENLKAAGNVYVASNGALPPEVDAALRCPIVIDRFPERGPLGAIASLFAVIREPRVFVTAGDAPFVSLSTIDELERAWEPGIDAVVPVNRDRILEPLCALYEREAMLQAASLLLHSPRAGVRDAVKILRIKRVLLRDDRVFADVDTEADRRAVLGALRP